MGFQVISEQGISEHLINDLIADKPDNTYKWSVRWYHKSGGLKKFWEIGADKCPITSLEFELNQKLMGAGSIELAYLDFPVDASDYLEVYYNNVRRYKAYVNNTIDPKGGVVELKPYHMKFEDVLYNGSFTSQTIAYILQTVIESVFDDTGIIYNSVYVDTGDIDTYTIEYEYENVKTIIDDLIKRLDGRFFGVNQYNIFEVYADNTEIDQYMFQIDRPFFTEINVDKDFDEIKVTRYQVYKKDTDGGSTSRVGQVGYDAPAGSYPTLAIETLIGGKIEDKITVSELLSDAEALDYAYAKLQAETDIPLSIAISSLNTELYFPVIRHLLKAQDRTEKILRTIIDCESTIGWAGDITVSLDTDNYCEGSASITFEAVSAVSNVNYDLDELKRWNHPEKISFMLKADYAGDYLELFAYSGDSSPYIADVDEYIADVDEYISVYGSTDSIAIPFHIPNGGVWNYYEFDLDITTFRYFGIRVVDTPPAASTINLDRVQLYLYHRTEYEANIKLAKITIDAEGTNCDLELNKIKESANDLLFSMDKKISALEAVNQT